MNLLSYSVQLKEAASVWGPEFAVASVTNSKATVTCEGNAFTIILSNERKGRCFRGLVGVFSEGGDLITTLNVTELRPRLNPLFEEYEMRKAIGMLFDYIEDYLWKKGVLK